MSKMKSELYAEIYYDADYKNWAFPNIPVDHGKDYSIDTRESTQDFSDCLQKVLTDNAPIEIIEAKLLEHVQAVWARKLWEPIKVTITSIYITRYISFEQGE